MKRQFCNPGVRQSTTKLDITHVPSGKQRCVWHLQYLDWADHGCPKDVASFLSKDHLTSDAIQLVLGPMLERVKNWFSGVSSCWFNSQEVFAKKMINLFSHFLLLYHPALYQPTSIHVWLALSCGHSLTANHLHTYRFSRRNWYRPPTLSGSSASWKQLQHTCFSPLRSWSRSNWGGNSLWRTPYLAGQ